jgi:protein-tyrosine phosphatase
LEAGAYACILNETPMREILAATRAAARGEVVFSPPVVRRLLRQVRAQATHESHALELTPRELELIAQGPAGTRWLLLECPFAGLDTEFAAAARRLTGLGYGLLLAHPERAAGILDDGWPILDELRSAGALLQVNVCSLLGNHGLAAQEIAAALARRGLAYCLASDGHPGTREHTLQLGFHLLIRAGASSVQAWRLTQANPRFLLRAGTPAVQAVRLAAA